MGAKSDVKINIWALGGAIFEIWGGFSRGLIFDEFRRRAIPPHPMDSRAPESEKLAEIGDTGTRTRAI